MERVVLESPAVDEGSAIGENHHAIAEHLPVDGLGGDDPGCRIENAGLQVGVGREIARARDNQHFAVMQKRGVDRIDGHKIGERLPLTLSTDLGCGAWHACQQKYAHKHYEKHEPRCPK
jgi:hypothetical protein